MKISLSPAMKIAAYLIYFVAGFVGLFAIAAGFEIWLGTPALLNFIMAMFTAYIPILGMILAAVGASEVWGWSLWTVIGVFGGSQILALVLVSAAEKASSQAGEAPQPSAAGNDTPNRKLRSVISTD